MRLATDVNLKKGKEPACTADYFTLNAKQISRHQHSANTKIHMQKKT